MIPNQLLVYLINSISLIFLHLSFVIPLALISKICAFLVFYFVVIVQ